MVVKCSKYLGLLWITVCMAACGGIKNSLPVVLPEVETEGTPVPITQPNAIPRFEKADCPEEVRRWSSPLCGYVVVPERHSDSNGKTIKIAVTIFSPAGIKPQKDPVLVISRIGSSFGMMGTFFIDRIRQAAYERVVITYDARGTGRSEPSLDCPGYGEIYQEMASENLDFKGMAEKELEALLACRAQLTIDEVGLSAYNNYEAALDVRDIEEALGYKSVNLMELESGGYLTQRILQASSEGIRAAIIQSPLPVTVNGGSLLAELIQYTLNTLFQRCADDSACDTAYPELEETFYQLLDELDASPLDLQVYGADNTSTNPVVINGDRFLMLVYGLSSNTFTSNYVPKLIDQVRQGKLDLLPSYARYIWGFSDASDLGAQQSATCAAMEGLTPARSDQSSTIAVHPRVALWLETEEQTYVEVCNQWGMMNEPRVSQNWSTQIPVLALTSTELPESIKAYNRIALENLPRSYEVQLSIPGDFLVLSDCGGYVSKAFLIQPAQKPDDSCKSKITSLPFEMP